MSEWMSINDEGVRKNEMNNNYPKISVITPSFNAGNYIEQAIQSVLAQNYPDFEHIVMDGGSTDGTIEILKKYPHLNWVSEPDRGQSHAMNKGFAISTGDIIVYLNADDFFEPNAFHTAVKYLDKNKGIYMVVGECNILDDAGKISRNRNIKTTFYEMLQWWRYSFPINPSSYFYYREVQEKVGYFDETNQYSLDYDFLLRAALHYKLYKIDAVLGNCRFIKGTKTYEYSAKDWHCVNQPVSRNYWKYLDLRGGFHVRYSYFRYRETLFRLKCIDYCRNILKQLCRKAG